MTVQDLRPNSQDISAFYLGNIYQVLADPNATHSSIPPPVAKPPPFTPPRYAVWVNTLWFLSLVMSVSCALWATSLQQWARRYLRRVQPARCRPERRARMRAFFAEGVEKMHIPWAVEGLPMLLHVSLFLFFWGLAIFLFNVDREVFTFVIGWIGLFSTVYGLITVLPIIRHNSPYHSPLSVPAWFLYTSIQYVTFKFLVFTGIGQRTRERRKSLKLRYRRWVLGGVEKAAEETASKRSSEIDLRILDWTISALGDDHSLESFFEAVPGFFSSRMFESLKKDNWFTLRLKFLRALRGFCERTLSSNSMSDSEKIRRLHVSIDTIDQISETHNRFINHEMGHTLDIPVATQRIIAGILVSVRERNDRWVTLAARVFGLPERDLRAKAPLRGDSVLLATLIHVTRQSLHSDVPKWVVLEALSKLDVCNTLPRLQHDFCTLWNEIVREAWKPGPRSSKSIRILKGIRQFYIALHQGTDATPTAFSASTDDMDQILRWPRSYPLCNLGGHHPASTPHLSVTLPTQPGISPNALSPTPTDGGSTTSRQVEQVVNNVIWPSSSNPITTSDIGATSHDQCQVEHTINEPTNQANQASRSASAGQFILLP